MKPTVVITGPNGYIANRIKDWLTRREPVNVIMLGLKDPGWKAFPFAGCSCVIHTAALVHRNERKLPFAEYEQINTVLTAELAQKAKAEGVPHFIFMSTMAVYGIRPSLFRVNEITHNTVCRPNTKYGISKLRAEKELQGLADESFQTAVIRPPIVYGKACPGNYNTLRRLTLLMKLMPRIENKKSVLYIDNLCELVCQIYRRKLTGTFMPQNERHVKTYELARLIAAQHHKRIICTRLLNPFVFVLSFFTKAAAKAFGSECYALSLSREAFDYQVCHCKESIARTER